MAARKGRTHRIYGNLTIAQIVATAQGEVFALTKGGRVFRHGLDKDELSVWYPLSEIHEETIVDDDEEDSEDSEEEEEDSEEEEEEEEEEDDEPEEPKPRRARRRRQRNENNGS